MGIRVLVVIRDLFSRLSLAFSPSLVDGDVPGGACLQALMWQLGKVVDTPESSRVYISSFWEGAVRNVESRCVTWRYMRSSKLVHYGARACLNFTSHMHVLIGVA
jgi:hypothetical protein